MLNSNNKINAVYKIWFSQGFAVAFYKKIVKRLVTYEEVGARQLLQKKLNSVLPAVVPSLIFYSEN